MTTSSFASPTEAGACSEAGEFKGEEDLEAQLVSNLGAVVVVRYGRSIGGDTFLPCTAAALPESAVCVVIRGEEAAAGLQSIRGDVVAWRSRRGVEADPPTCLMVERIDVEITPMLHVGDTVLNRLEAYQCRKLEKYECPWKCSCRQSLHQNTSHVQFTM